MMHFFPSRAVAVSIGVLQIHWYGLLYAVAFVVGAFILRRILRYRDLTLNDTQFESLVFGVFLGVLVGGRLGYVLFYGDRTYIDHPLEILAVWHGGMASHGGFIGVLLALLTFCRRQKISFLRLTDTLMIPVALGLAFGRLGNLINGELYGTVTTLPWGMHFPGVEGLRHPTQIYAILKDLLIASVCFVHLKRSWPNYVPGRVAAIFLMMYGVLRFVVEIFRDQPLGYSDVLGLSLSRGQLLTIPLIAIGIALWILTRRCKFS